MDAQFKNFKTYLYNAEWSGAGLQRVTWEDLPMVEHALRESLTSGI